MARKRHSDQDSLRLLREIELHLTSGGDGVPGRGDQRCDLLQLPQEIRRDGTITAVRVEGAGEAKPGSEGDLGFDT